MMTLLEKLGLVFLILIGARVLKKLAVLFYRAVAPSFNLNADLKKMGSWAVVTGATDGLGKAFAEQLAGKGINIVLVSRTKAKLETVADEISKKYQVDTKIIEADFTQGQAAFPSIEQGLADMDVGILVNNVGMSYPYPQYFLELEKKEKIYGNIIQCNIESMLGMCQIVMPGMVQKKKGVIINISSTAGNIPSPLLSVYGASKIFVSKFSKDLASEYKKKGIIVQCLAPGYVATKMSKIKKPTWMAPSPTEYVRRALRTVGIESYTTGYYPHSLLVGLIHLMEAVSPILAERMIIRTMENIRSRALKRIPTMAS